MKKLALVFAGLLTLSSLFASSPFARGARGEQELVPSGSWVYDSLNAIALESKILNFAVNTPVTIQELKTILAEIDYDSLSDAGRAEYDRIFAYFKQSNFAFASDILSIGMDPHLNLEAFYKTNSDISWLWDRYERGGMLEIPFTISMSDYVTMSMDLALQQNKAAANHNYNYTNIFYNPDDFDINFPSTGYFSTGTKVTEKTGVSFQIGMFPQNVGRTQTGSIILSDYLTGTTQAKLSLYSPAFKYTGEIIQFNVDKYFYSHQIDFRFFKKVSLTVFEALLVYAPMELRYMNPWNIFHGFAAWREYGDYDGNRDKNDPESHTCDYFGLILQVNPFSGLRFYGMLCFTQYQTPYETSNYSDGVTPNGLGFQGGGEWYYPLNGGYFHLGLEGTYTQPYLYIKESPNWSMVRTYSENMGDKAIFYEWVGSPFGPDTISGELTAGYTVPSKFSVDGTYLFMARGEMSGTKVFNDVDWGGQDTDLSAEYAKTTWCYPTTTAQRDLTTPTGTPEYVHRLSVRATYHATDWLSVTTQPGYVMLFNKDNVEGQKAKGFEIALAVKVSLLHNIQ